MANARTIKDKGSECREVYDDDVLVARIVPHDSGSGWKGVNLIGRTLTVQPYSTPQLVLHSYRMTSDQRTCGM
jgi:hypothetical protein